MDHKEEDAIVRYSSHSNVKPCDHSKFTPPLNVVDECEARSIEQVAGDTTLRKGQLVPEDREKDFFSNKKVLTGILTCL